MAYFQNKGMLGLLVTIVSFIVSGRNAVEVGGQLPLNSDVIYSSTATTGAKGQLTKGNSVLLELSGWQGQSIERVVLQMKSNQTSGAGRLAFVVNDDVQWAIADASFSHSSWNGAFSTNVTEITKTFSPAIVCEDGTVRLTIEATQNSLYLSAVEIEYTSPAPQAATVTFVTHTPEQVAPRTEQEAGGGVELPCCVWSDGEWRFVGWTSKPVEETTLQPFYLPAGEYIYPQADMTCYALYQKGETQEGYWQTTEFVSGKYVMSVAGMIASGDVVGNQLRAEEVELKQQSKDGEWLWYSAKNFAQDAVYNVNFLTDTTASIQHVGTKHYLWHTTQNKLTNQYGVWNVKKNDDHTLFFYYTDKEKYYTLFLGASELDDFYYNISTIKLSTATGNGMVLFPVTPKEKIEYTSYPMGMYEGWQDVKVDDRETIVPFGIYEIHIRNGQKIVRLR